jgi:hypothetical protein
MKIKKRFCDKGTALDIDGIPIVHSYKYLGLQIKESLKCDLRLQSLKEKLRSFQFFMAKLRPSLVSLKTRLQLWKTFFCCHVLYGLECIFLDAPTLRQLKVIYSVSLKKALHLPLSCGVDELLLATNTLTLDSLLTQRLATITK